MQWRVPKEWPGETAAILACGPSLTQSDVDLCKGLRVIAINRAFEMAPWADILYGCDQRFWEWYPEALNFEGAKVTMQSRQKGLLWLDNTGVEGLEEDPGGLRTGRNGGHQAVNLAYHLGVRRILLLGYDMRSIGGEMHFHKEHKVPTKPTICDGPGGWVDRFRPIAEALKEREVEVINCTPGSALDCFPMMPLSQALHT